jgi:hypothetical protein
MQTMPITSCNQREPADGISAGAASFELETMESSQAALFLNVA